MSSLFSRETIKIPARIKPDEQRSLFVACFLRWSSQSKPWLHRYMEIFPVTTKLDINKAKQWIHLNFTSFQTLIIPTRHWSPNSPPPRRSFVRWPLRGTVALRCWRWKRRLHRRRGQSHSRATLCSRGLSAFSLSKKLKMHQKSSNIATVPNFLNCIRLALVVSRAIRGAARRA